MLVLLPPSAGKATPAGEPVRLDELFAADVLTKPRDRILRALRLTEAPAGPAAEVYTGVLYGQLRLPELEAQWDRVLIASAVFGAVRPDDRICAYKADMGARVPRMKESLTAFWRRPLAKALPDDGLVLDLRSGSYAAAWRPSRALGVRGFTEAPDGRRTVITHMAKRVRGDVARLVLQHDADSPEDVKAVCQQAGLRVELTSATLDVIEPG